jgi:alpha-D-xyloside xylohydrolase
VKFSKGLWQMMEDVEPVYPVRVHEVEQESEAITLTAADRPDHGRGSYVGGTLFSMRVSSPLPDVLRLTITHFQGGLPRRPSFDLVQAHAPLEMREDGDTLTIGSGKLALEIRRKGEWRYAFLGEGRRLTQSGPKALGLMRKGERTYLREQLALGVGEVVYGLGERFTTVARNGQSIDTWNEDPGTASDLAYKNVPFFLTNRGYGVLVNHPGRVSFEIATERVNATQFSVEGESLDYFLFYGRTPKEVIERYTALSGRPALPPAWSFGLWLTTSFITQYDETTVSSFIEGMAARNLPLHVFHFDCFWMREYQWCNFAWDAQTFPDPRAMLARLKSRGLKICVWINPYIGQRSPLFREAMAAGYLLKRPNGDVFQIDDWQPGCAYVDFTNPDALAWYQEKLALLLEMGVDCFKTDFGERIPTDVVYADRSDPERMHNYYSYLYNKAVFDLLERRRGPGEAVLFARSATAGSQKLPVHWGGDCLATFESMAETLRGGLSLGLCGFAHWSHDISGFEHTATPTLYKRWVAFGLLSSHSRLHGSGSPRVPWSFDEESVDVLRFFTHLKCRLMPYLFEAACQACRTGVPLLRHMLLEFPDDPASLHLERQYMLGSALLVAPVFNDQGEAEYYLPHGEWAHLLSGRIETGGRFIRERVGFGDIPLYQRPDTVVALGSVFDRPDYDYANGVELRAHALSEGSRHEVPIVDTRGNVVQSFSIARSGGTVTATARSEAKPWRMRFVGTGSPREVLRGTVVDRLGEGLIVAPDGGTLSFRT